MEDAADEVDGGTLAAAIDVRANRKDLSEAERLQLGLYVNTEIAQEFAADADQLSATKFDEGEYTTGPQVTLLRVATTTCRERFAQGLEVVMNTFFPVTNVVRRTDSVTVRAGDRSYDGSAAIVTVPLGVLKAGSVAFDPPLPEGHAHAVEALGFGVLSKSYFRFEQRTWKSEKDFHQFLGTDPTLWAQWFTLPIDIGPIVLALNAGRKVQCAEESASP